MSKPRLNNRKVASVQVFTAVLFLCFGVLTYTLFFLGIQLPKSAIISFGLSSIIYGIWGISQKVYTKRYSQELITGKAAIRWGYIIVIGGILLLLLSFYF